MINPLYEPFPDSVAIQGKQYKIITDFREYIKLLELLRDEEVDTVDKCNLIMQWFLEIPENATFKECLDALADFVTMKEHENISQEEEEKEENRDDRKQILSYSMDAPYILSGFLECYGIDLQKIPYMHWWKFQMLLNGLNEETELKKRMSYRSVDISKIKDREERDRIRKIQKQIAIIEKEASDEDIGNAFGSMMW